MLSLLPFINFTSWPNTDRYFSKHYSQTSLNLCVLIQILSPRNSKRSPFKASKDLHIAKGIFKLVFSICSDFQEHYIQLTMTSFHETSSQVSRTHYSFCCPFTSSLSPQQVLHVLHPKYCQHSVMRLFLSILCSFSLYNKSFISMDLSNIYITYVLFSYK